jgi:hypothetical protein
MDKTLINAVERALKICPQIYLHIYKYPETYCDKSDFVKPKESTLDKVLFYRRNIVGFYVSSDQKPILFILDDNGALEVILFFEGNKKNKSEIVEKFKEHYFHFLVLDTFVYNPELVKKKGKDQYIFNATKINFESILKFEEFITRQIGYVDEELKKDKNKNTDDISINPFYGIFNKLDFSETWE